MVSLTKITLMDVKIQITMKLLNSTVVITYTRIISAMLN